MADQAITALPKKTNSGSNKIAATDYMLGIDSAEGYQMLIKDLGDYIIQNVQSSLMGSNQTLATALSALNSNTHILATTLDDLCSKILALPSSRTVPLFIPATVTSALINVNMVGKGYVSKVSNIVADIVIYSGANGELYSARVNPTTKEVSNVTSIPTRAEVNALNSKDLAGKGTLIPSNSDLNTYINVGKYYANSSDTLQNCPASAYGFSLYVVNEGASQLKQMFVQNTYVTDIYVRQRAAGGTWGSWDHIIPRDVSHPIITDVLTPADDITIISSYVSVCDRLMIMQCH